MPVRCRLVVTMSRRRVDGMKASSEECLRYAFAFQQLLPLSGFRQAGSAVARSRESGRSAVSVCTTVSWLRYETEPRKDDAS